MAKKKITKKTNARRSSTPDGNPPSVSNGWNETATVTVEDILRGSSHALTIFKTETIAALDIFNKRGKPYLKCYATGKVTVHTIFHVWGNEFTAQGPTKEQAEYASENVYGIDFDLRSVKIAKALNLIAGDGRTSASPGGRSGRWFTAGTCRRCASAIVFASTPPICALSSSDRSKAAILTPPAGPEKGAVDDPRNLARSEAKRAVPHLRQARLVRTIR